MNQDPFVAACAAALDKSGDRDAPIREFYRAPRVEKIINAVVWKYGLGDQDADDIRHKLVMLFQDSLLASLREPEAVYSVLYNAAWRLTSTQVRKRTEASLEDLADRAQGGLSIGLGTDDMIGFLLHEQQALDHRMDDQVISGVDKARAIEAFNRSYVGDHASRQADRPRRSGKAKVAAAGNTGQMRLREIRQQLQLTVLSFAQQLDVEASRMQSMLYGPAARVPDELLRAAEELLRERPRTTSTHSNWLREAPMREIVVTWLRRLQMLAPSTAEQSADSIELEKGLLSGLAGILDVNRSTVWRWFDQGQKPRARELELFDRTVLRHVAPTANSS